MLFQILTDSEVKLLSLSTQLGMEFIMLINVTMPTLVFVDILIFINRIKTTSESLKA